MFDAWSYDGLEGVEALFEQPPDSVRQVLSDYTSWPDLVRNEDAQLDPHAVAILPDNYQFIGGGHESVWSLNAMLQRTAQGGLWTPDLSDVSADYLAAWRWTDDRVAAIWRLRSPRHTPLLNDLTAGVWRLDGDVATTHLVAEVDDDLLLIAVSEGDAVRVGNRDERTDAATTPPAERDGRRQVGQDCRTRQESVEPVEQRLGADEERRQGVRSIRCGIRH